MDPPLDHLAADHYSAIGGTPAVLLDLAEPGAERRAAALARLTPAVIVGLDTVGQLPAVDPAAFDVLLTMCPAAPRPWIAGSAAGLAARGRALVAAAGQAPVAATTLCQVLRAGEQLAMPEAIRVESLAYSMLLAGREFARWLASRAGGPGTAAPAGPFVEVERTGDLVTIALARPDRRNALCAGMRDALWEALAAALDDPTRPRVRLVGAGDCFSTGGDLAEFGQADDVAAAHVVRTLRSCAVLLGALGDRAEVLLHGACIGSGIEVPAAAARRRARAGAFFQLPELRMGLIPGAGGTATVARAIGRHRTAYMALSGRRIGLATAADWGLVTP